MDEHIRFWSPKMCVPRAAAMVGVPEAAAMVRAPFLVFKVPIRSFRKSNFGAFFKPWKLPKLRVQCGSTDLTLGGKLIMMVDKLEKKNMVMFPGWAGPGKPRPCEVFRKALEEAKEAGDKLLLN
ncbi:hypothetical protein M231_06250 [Tremella mesenterica]|uniref:Uncharacterized protein n=1 Tax=Tremella mesenterica TaxID=5217 RepID=A0A4Q1BE56_TREME|nr:hypothetical protein M231_06250 [Tremella mesenterica]